MVSLFPNLHTTTDGQQVELSTALEGIKNGQWRTAVELVQAEPDHVKRQALKKRHLPYFTPSGTFSHRAERGLIQHSGVIALDCDPDKNPDADWADLRQRICADDHTLAVFRSASGVGLCAMIPVPPTDSKPQHEGVFRALEEYYLHQYGLVIDSLPDMSRARYVSFDPDLYYNPNAVLWDSIIEKKPAPAQPVKASTFRASAQGDGYGQAVLRKLCDRILTAPDGTKHVTLNKAAYTLGGIVASGFLREEEARAALQDAISRRTVGSQKQAFTTIEDGLKAGRAKPLFPEPLEHIVRKLLDDGETVGAVAMKIAASQGMVADVAQQMVQAVKDDVEPELLTWWAVDEAKGEKGAYKVRVVLPKFRDWLAESGFRKMLLGEKYTYVRISNQIVTPLVIGQIQDFARLYIESLPIRFDKVWRAELENAFMMMGRTLFAKEVGLLSYLDPLPVDALLRDTANEARFFYANTWVSVTAQAVTCKSYSELPGLVWAEQVRGRSFEPPFVDEPGDFGTFVQRITANNPARLDGLRRAIGYYLHGFKDSAVKKAVILCDEAVGMSGEPNGGTGKSLIFHALGKLVPVCVIDGKGYDERDGKAMQRVTAATRVLFFDDLEGRKVRFDRFFNMISDGLVVTRLYSGEEAIPYERSPKLGFALNDTFASPGESHARRKVEIEIAPYYSASHTPIDEFKRRFFDDWDTEEWQRFDAFMLDSCRAFLAHGLPTPTNINLNQRKTAQMTGGNEAFIAFMDEQPRNEALPFADLRRTFREQESIGESELSHNKFTAWVNAYAAHYNVQLTTETIYVPSLLRKAAVITLSDKCK